MTMKDPAPDKLEEQRRLEAEMEANIQRLLDEMQLSPEERECALSLSGALLHRAKELQEGSFKVNNRAMPPSVAAAALAIACCECGYRIKGLGKIG
jgi:hypothetical protein